MWFVRVFVSMVLLLLAGNVQASSVKVPATVEVKAGRLAKIVAVSETPVRWLNLHADLDLVEDSSGKVAFVLGSKPGTYKVAAFTGDAGGPSEPAFCEVVVTGGSTPPVTPPIMPPTPKPPESKANPAKALVKLRFGNSGCTATMVGPQRLDGRWDILTAAHCTGAVGTIGEATTQDGRKFRVTVASRDAKCDLCWLIADTTDADHAFAELATEEPAVGVAVWHAGYGIDKPGNREKGKVLSTSNSAGQLNFMLSVSPGDSGGGIFRDDDGRLLSAVCCTAGLARVASMWGGSCVLAGRMRGKASIEYPILELQCGHWPE